MSTIRRRMAAYVPVAERRRKAEREMEKLLKKGYSAAPIRIEGRTIVTSFWGKAWCDNLESYRDYESRLPRGRTYVRNGSVVDLQIAPREVTAMVSGSSIYQVAISIGTVQKVQWQSICADCGNGIDSLVELLQGRLSKGVMERICRQDIGLFPRPSEIRFTCSCPDYASMCKHVAAVLYGVGARLDREPELLFRLRAVDENELVAQIGTVLPMANTSPAAGRVLDVNDVSALFGLDIVGVDAAQEFVGDATAASPPDGHRPSGAASEPRRKNASIWNRKRAPPRRAHANALDGRKVRHPNRASFVRRPPQQPERRSFPPAPAPIRRPGARQSAKPRRPEPATGGRRSTRRRTSPVPRRSPAKLRPVRTRKSRSLPERSPRP